jgi:hypothetical protein
MGLTYRHNPDDSNCEEIPQLPLFQLALLIYLSFQGLIPQDDILL